MILGDKLLMEMYRKMLAIRLFEGKVSELFHNREIPGFVHLYIGQEAVAVGVCSALREGDRITSTHRGHGHLIAKGADMKKMMAEIFGKTTGYCKGKGGSMHIADFQRGILGANGIVGAGIPIAVGAGLAERIRRKDGVTICFFGDGASNQGTFHESMNLAAIWKIPVIFVCENNSYAFTTPASYSLAMERVSERAKLYGAPGITVDGNDVIQVYNATKVATARARAGEGPTLIEAKTYRWQGHFEGEDVFFPPGSKYRKEEEIEEWKRRDPISRIEARLLREGITSKEELQKVEEEIKAEVEEAVSFAKGSPLPTGKDALEDLFA